MASPLDSPLYCLLPSRRGHLYSDFAYGPPPIESVDWWARCLRHVTLSSRSLSFRLEDMPALCERGGLRPLGLQPVCASLVQRGDLLVDAGNKAFTFAPPQPPPPPPLYHTVIVGVTNALVAASRYALRELDTLITGGGGEGSAHELASSSDTCALPPRCRLVVVPLLRDATADLLRAVTALPPRSRTLLLVHPPQCVATDANEGTDSDITNASELDGLLSLPQLVSQHAHLSYLLARSIVIYLVETRPSPSCCKGGMQQQPQHSLSRLLLVSRPWRRPLTPGPPSPMTTLSPSFDCGSRDADCAWRSPRSPLRRGANSRSLGGRPPPCRYCAMQLLPRLPPRCPACAGRARRASLGNCGAPC